MAVIQLSGALVGDELDEPEWDQTGIKREEYEGFVSFLKELYLYLNLKSVVLQSKKMFLNYLSLTNHSLTNVIVTKICILRICLNNHRVSYIICRGKYKKLSHIPYNHTRLDCEGVFIETDSCTKEVRFLIIKIEKLGFIIFNYSAK
ncbi:hypothetical protein [Bacillus sp. FSL K6-3431]|uniref:hypothetical protein n=1 Tax=Bacillus sp. FSL K6-3431 TaxID=2921500 RepID=UPI0030FCEF48